MSHSSALSEAKRQLLSRYLKGGAGRQEQTIGMRPSGEPTCLSPAQSRMWQHARTRPELTCYNEPITIYRKGPLDLRLLERSFTELVTRHEAWRTTFTTENGCPVQVIHPPCLPPIQFRSVQHLPASEREAVALRLASEQARIPFDLEQGPLFRVLVVQLAEDEYRIFITAHHLTLDGVTVFHILYFELTAIYDALQADTTPQLQELPIQYADFAYWQKQRLTPELITREVAYWQSQLSNAQTFLALPTDYPRTAEPSFQGAIHSFSFSKNLTGDLRTFSQEQGVTLFVALLTGFAVLMHRYTGQQDIVVGTVAPGGRKHSEVQHLMGLMQHRLPLRIAMTGDPELRGLVSQIRYVVSEALCHDDVPFEIIGDHLLTRPAETLYPFFQTMFSLEPPVARAAPGWGFTTMDFDPGGARMDLYIEMDDRPSGMLGRAQYNTGLFREDTIKRLARDLETTLATLIADPRVHLSQLGTLKLVEE